MMRSSKQSGVYIENFYSWETSIWKENGVGKASEVGTTHQGTPRGAWHALVYRAHLDHLPVYFFISKILKYSKTDKKYFCGFFGVHLLFFNTVQMQALTYTRIHSPLWTHTRTPYPYEHLRKTEPAYYLEIYEVIVGASSSTETSPPTECASSKILK